MEINNGSSTRRISRRWFWLFLSGIAILLFKSTIETVVEGLKVFLGKDLNTDDVVILDGRPARCIRVGLLMVNLM